MSVSTALDEGLLSEEQPFDTRDPKLGGWALIEIMGHRSHHGFVREVQVFGATMCQVLVPFHDKPGVQSRHVYGGSAIFSLSPCSKAECIKYAPRNWSVSPHPQLTGGAAIHDFSHDDDDDDVEDGDFQPGDGEEGDCLRQRDHAQSPDRGESTEGASHVE